MTPPTIHLNGTSKESLMGDLDDAYDALNAAYDAIKRTAPNGRDYYPQGPGAITSATNEHLSRLQRVQSVQEELSELMQAIYDQGN